MKQPIPNFTLEQNRTYKVYVPSDRDAFPPEAWASQLRTISTAQTVQDQRIALGNTILLTAVENRTSLASRAHSRSQVWLPGLRASFQHFATAGITPQLRSLHIYNRGRERALLGYPTPRSDQPAPYVVVDINSEDGSEHETIGRADAPLSPLLVQVNELSVAALTTCLSKNDPGFALLQQMNATKSSS